MSDVFFNKFFAKEMVDKTRFLFTHRDEMYARELLPMLDGIGGRIHHIDHHWVVAVDKEALHRDWGKLTRATAFYLKYQNEAGRLNMFCRSSSYVRSTFNGWRGWVSGLNSQLVELRLTHDRHGRSIRKPIRKHVSFNELEHSWKIDVAGAQAVENFLTERS